MVRLIVDESHFYAENMQFQFQNGSINSILQIPHINILLVFQFQNGSINSLQREI